MHYQGQFEVRSGMGYGPEEPGCVTLYFCVILTEQPGSLYCLFEHMSMLSKAQYNSIVE